MNNRIKKYAKALGNALSVLSLIFIVYAVWKLGYKIDFSIIANWPLFAAVVIVSTVIKTMTVFLQGNGWGMWLAFFSGKKDQRADAIILYTKANIGKYIPGNVMHYVERNLFAASLGISQKKITLCSVLEVLGLIVIAAVLAVLFSFSSLVSVLNQLFGEKLPIVMLITLIAGFLILAVVIVYMYKKRELLQRYEMKEFLKVLFINLVQYAVVLISLGIILVGLFWCSGGRTDIYNAFLIISGYITAWVLGFVIPGASGGLGIREFVLTFLVGEIIGKNYILPLTVIHRGITIAGDFIAYLIAVVLQKMKATHGDKKDEGC